MWSAIFCIWIGLVNFVGLSIAAHSILLIGVFFTADIFRRASQNAKKGQPIGYDQLFKDPRDGCAKYDDVWGG